MVNDDHAEELLDDAGFKNLKQTHIWSGVIIGSVMLVFLFWIIPNFTSPPDSKLDLAPSFIPSLAVAVTLFLAILLAIMAFFSSSKNDALHEEFGEEASGIGLDEFKNLGLWILVSIGAWFGTVHVGFEPAMTVCLALGMFFAGNRNYWLTALIAITTPIILSQLAWYIFTTELPGFWRT